MPSRPEGHTIFGVTKERWEYHTWYSPSRQSVSDRIHGVILCVYVLCVQWYLIRGRARALLLVMFGVIGVVWFAFRCCIALHYGGSSERMARVAADFRLLSRLASVSRARRVTQNMFAAGHPISRQTCDPRSYPLLEFVLYQGPIH